MKGKEVKITDKTTIPLFAVLGAGVVLLGAFTSTLLWVSSIGSKAEAAITKNVEQDARADRQGDFITRQQDLLIQINDRTARMESAVQILLQRSK